MSICTDAVGEGDVLRWQSAFTVHSQEEREKERKKEERTNTARIDSHTIILIPDACIVNMHPITIPHIKRIRIRRTTLIARRPIHRDVLKRDVLAAADAKDRDGRVGDPEVREAGRLDAVHGEELGLVLAAVQALPVPVLRAAAVEPGPFGAGHFELRARDGDERTGPFFVREGGFAGEDDLGGD